MVGRPRSMQRTSGVCRSGCGLEQQLLPRIHGIPRPLVAAAEFIGDLQPIGPGIIVYRPGEPECAHQILPFYRIGFIGNVRSEEHTSELQSLMRISYAVFCLKKKKKTKKDNYAYIDIKTINNCYTNTTRHQQPG